MNNIKDIQTYLAEINAQKNYEFWVEKLSNYSKKTIFMQKQQREINKDKLLHHLNNLKYLIYGDLPKTYGGLQKNLEKLKEDRQIDADENSEIFEKLFQLVIPSDGIKYPLCNSCLKEFKPKNKNWKTSKKKELEYIIDKKGTKYEGKNYLHICSTCHILLLEKIDRYKEIKMEKFDKNKFSRQSEEYLEYQPICFKLLQSNKK